MSKRLLILIDGEEVTARALALDLTEAGYDVETARDRDEAIQKLRGAFFDLVIAAEPPGGGGPGRGFDGLRAVQPGAKVVLVTTGEAREESCELGGAAARVRMPFDLEEIRSVVARLLEGKEAAAGKAM